MAEFVLLPFAMGIINTYFWKDYDVSGSASWGYGFISFIIALFGSAFFMGEGYICLIIVSPLIFLFMMSGIWAGRAIFRQGNNKLNVSVAGAIVAFMAINVAFAGPSEKVVSDRIVIQASPDQVWKYIVSFPAIEEKPSYWMFRIGLPAPVQSVAEGEFVGANRQCVFNGGIVFDEKIVELVPGRKLTFDIVKQPEDPEIMGHLELRRGQFVLEDNGDGTTTLIGNSWYDLKVRPSAYFDWWTQDIIRAVHIRVMEHIKALAENDN
ncbi:SRPBCC family protein [Cohnella endophytica]|uniref:SRPBCC family protein n=1 Tax=Cohnella endophytica TaxID=2419778 RepID=UPI0013141DCB|nr:SRPBCC family protein [Cohnella endophytica]